MSSQLTAAYRQARHNPTLCVLEGLHAIKHALRFGADVVSMHATPDGDWHQLALSHAGDIAHRIHENVVELSENAFKDLSPHVHATGIIAIAKRPLVDKSVVYAEPRNGPIIILDRPAHSGNTGAVIRTAAAAGAHAVLTTGPDDPWHPSTLRGAAGLHFAMTVARIETVSLAGLEIVGMDDRGTPFQDTEFNQKGVFVLGSERYGLSEEIKQHCIKLVALPMREGVSSLNLAASAAILLYQTVLHRPISQVLKSNQSDPD